ncbi:HRDC-like protein [Clohesyomyces aquaticus]|uniref:HRDC-like protein n=1 Tax=Clohesyomyces aquaticus TaxID=1231657 RepID=A0A1Y1ZWG0_9PLEO|nr:HRDC-like protein [Clohesyomyces aquaticus]
MDDETRELPRRAPAPPPIFRAPKQVSRPKAVIQQEEELGAEPKLGDFEDVHALSVSEARAVITAVHSARKKKDPGSNPLGADRVHNDSQYVIAHPTITAFMEYLETFSRYKQNENLHALSGLLDSQSELTSVEKAMLGSLACDSADEAKTLIPSLANKMTDEALQSMLDEMQKLRGLLIHG